MSKQAAAAPATEPAKNVRNLFSPRRLYDIYVVKLQLRERLYGGISRNEDLLSGQIRAKIGIEDAITEGIVAEALEKMIDKEIEKSWTGFYRDPERGVYFETRQIKACIKQGASMLGILKKKRGSKQIVCEGMEVKALDGDDSRVFLGKPQSDGCVEKPIHVMTAQGPRTALKRVDYVERPLVEFELWLLKTHPSETRHLTEEDIIEILRFSQENGLGADRSQGCGKFDVVEFTKVSE
jgi:hypothetical protein